MGGGGLAAGGFVNAESGTVALCGAESGTGTAGAADSAPGAGGTVESAGAFSVAGSFVPVLIVPWTSPSRLMSSVSRFTVIRAA